MTGRDKCELLRSIRRQIAEANDIEYVETKCTHKGDCLGTCPVCEAEIKYIDEQLNKRASNGKKVTISGLDIELDTKAKSYELPDVLSYEEENYIRGGLRIFTKDGSCVDDSVVPYRHEVPDSIRLLIENICKDTSKSEYLTCKQLVEEVVNDYVISNDIELKKSDIKMHIKKVCNLLHNKYGIISVKRASDKFRDMCIEIAQYCMDNIEDESFEMYDQIMGLPYLDETIKFDIDEGKDDDDKQ